MRTLIVGGPHDGEWRDTDTTSPHWNIPIRRPIPVMPFDADLIPGAVTAEIATYTRRRWRCAPDAEWFIWSSPSMSDAQVMDRLLQGYRPSAWRENDGT